MGLLGYSVFFSGWNLYYSDNTPLQPQRSTEWNPTYTFVRRVEELQDKLRPKSESGGAKNSESVKVVSKVL